MLARDVLAIGIYSYATDGAPIRFPQEKRELISSYSFEHDLSHTCSMRPNDYQEVSPNYSNENCTFGDVSKPKAEVLLIGDSHADYFKPFVDELAKDAGMKAVYQVQGVCLPTVLAKPGQPAESATTCERRNAGLLAIAGNCKCVVLAGCRFFDPERNFHGELAAMVDKIVRSGATPFVFKDNAIHEHNFSRCVLQKRRGWIPADTDCNFSVEYVAQTDGAADRAMRLCPEQHAVSETSAGPAFIYQEIHDAVH